MEGVATKRRQFLRGEHESRHRAHHLVLKETGALCEAGVDVHIAVVFRTGAFLEDQACPTCFKSTPAAVFDTINQVVTSTLASDPLHVPDLGSCIVVTLC